MGIPDDLSVEMVKSALREHALRQDGSGGSVGDAQSIIYELPGNAQECGMTEAYQRRNN